MQNISTRKNLMNLTGLALIGVLAVAIAVAALGVRPVAAAPPQQGSLTDTITVSGFGSASGAPDVAVVSLGVEINDPELGAAVAQANTTLEAIAAVLSDLGIAPEDMQTVNFSVWSDEPFDPAMSAPSGQRTYRVSNIMRVTVRDLTQVQAVLDAAINAGANTIHGLNFGLDDAAALEQDARIAALDNARERAGQIAEAIGVSLGDVVNVIEGGSGGIMADMALRSAGIGGGGGIQEGQLSVDVQVQVTFAIVR
jgi:uncharacterized protein YggE